MRVGCSGWQYRHWRGRFYPDGLASSHWLEFYARQFDTVELNNSFYRLPEAATFAAWRRRVHTRFVFAVKASRFLTHMKKLKDPAEPLDRFFTRAAALGPTCGPVLYQLPPNFTVNVERLDAFVRQLPRGRRHTIEFRHPSWHIDRVFMLLERHGVALCLHDMAGSATGREAVGPFTYVRFHGTARYSGSYPDARLESWADWIAAHASPARPAYAYFNNDIDAHAPRDAVRLRAMVHARLQAEGRLQCRS